MSGEATVGRSIEVTVEDPVCIIRLDRPERLNALTFPMLDELRAAVDAAAADPRVVGIVITGNGRGFCSGLDAAVLAAVTGGEGFDGHDGARPATAEELPGLFSYLLQVPKPVVAAINGVAAGGGVVLASMCDVRLASDAASFTTVFLQRGLVAEHGTSWILPRLLGPGRALDLLWTGRRITADEALTVGMVEYVVPAAELLDRAVAYVGQIAASSSPATVAATKRMVYDHLGTGYEQALRDADAEAWRAVEGPDATEGAQALIEKRPPAFRRLGERA